MLALRTTTQTRLELDSEWLRFTGSKSYMPKHTPRKNSDQFIQVKSG